jgi:hypothetical protein
MARQPAMRTSNARDFLEFLGRAYPEVHRQVRDTLPRPILDRIEQGVRTDWIPVELDGQYVDMVLGILGPAGMRTCSREFVVQSLVRSPMMHGLFDGVRRVFGLSVGSLVRVLPRGLQQSYQDAFTVEVERSDQQAVVVFEDIAPEVLRFGAYPLLWEGIFLGLYDLARAPPRLDFKLLRGARRVEARVRW